VAKLKCSRSGTPAAALAPFSSRVEHDAEPAHRDGPSQAGFARLLGRSWATLALMSARYFRWFIILSVLLAGGAAALDALFPSLIPQSLSIALENEPVPRIIENLTLSLVLFLPLAAASITGVVGLFLFKRWGRTLSLYSTVLGFGLYPFLGPTVSSGWSSTLSEASVLLWGAVLAVAYVSPLRDRFSVRSTNER